MSLIQDALEKANRAGAKALPSAGKASAANPMPQAKEIKSQISPVQPKPSLFAQAKPKPIEQPNKKVQAIDLVEEKIFQEKVEVFRPLGAPMLEPKTAFSVKKEIAPMTSIENKEIAASIPWRSMAVVGGIFFIAAFTVYLILQAAFKTSSPSPIAEVQVATRAAAVSKGAPVAPVTPKTILPVSKKGPKFKLTGVTFSGDERIAVINDMVVGVGDYVDPKTVVKYIGQSRAIVEENGKTIELSLG